MLDEFDRLYYCDGGFCSITFVLSFSVADVTTFDSSDNEVTLCAAIQSYFVTQSTVGGDWACRVSPRPTKDDNARFYAVITYSEGSRGLSGGQKAGIIIGCLLILLLLVVIVAVIFVQSQSKSRADYV